MTGSAVNDAGYTATIRSQGGERWFWVGGFGRLGGLESVNESKTVNNRTKRKTMLLLLSTVEGPRR